MASADVPDARHHLCHHELIDHGHLIHDDQPFRQRDALSGLQIALIQMNRGMNRACRNSGLLAHASCSFAGRSKQRYLAMRYLLINLNDRRKHGGLSGPRSAGQDRYPVRETVHHSFLLSFGQMNTFLLQKNVLQSLCIGFF